MMIYRVKRILLFFLTTNLIGIICRIYMLGFFSTGINLIRTIKFILFINIIFITIICIIFILFFYIINRGILLWQLILFIIRSISFR